MPLHRLTTITVGVPDVDQTASYYTDFGLTPLGGNAFATVDGGEQFRLTRTAQRRLIEMGIGVDDADDLDRIERQLGALDLPVRRDQASISALEPIAGFRAIISIAPRISQERAETPPYNGPGRIERVDRRAEGIQRMHPVRPRKLGHVVIGSTDQVATQRFFTDGLGFKVSDTVPSLAAFLRCSSDHHNVLVQQAPLNFLHHTSWQVDDVDEIGRGATAMLQDHPDRHVWGLGRHHIGSNFFWYLKDPAGNFSEYYSDIDCIVDEALWKPGIWDDARALYNWGPPPPPSFLMPDDLAALMTGAHAAM